MAKPKAKTKAQKEAEAQAWAEYCTGNAAAMFLNMIGQVARRLAAAEVMDLARLQFDHDEVAAILETDADLIRTDQELAKAYHVGTLKGEAEIRRSIMTMAKQGSSPAQKQYVEMIINRKRADRQRERDSEKSKRPRRQL